ncbi:M36 family metallopeptidase [Neolewinella sp.]|uniref:M36 family metallopeptidase n=1 Tax=Neolewinella sp. TaxID=2993543 RepID=UPI003B521B8D
MKAFLLLALLIGCLPLAGQEGGSPALQFLRDRVEQLDLVDSDLWELRVTDQYVSPDGTEHVYVGQSLYGTPIYNAQAAVHYRGGRAIYHTSSLERDIRRRGQATVPRLTDDQAFLRLGLPASTRMLSADMVYYPLPGPGATLELAWQVVSEDAKQHTTLHMVDAATGAELYQTSLTLSCSFDEAPGAGAGAKQVEVTPSAAAGLRGDGALYNVFPFGLESPADGPRQLLLEPADTLASPYGWHDTNGKPGPEYTTTRGNNVWAYRDADTTRNEPDPGFAADGGAELDFDFFFDTMQRPVDIVEASLTQLFYTNNMLHDWLYRHGFDEASGNYQQNNYGRGGRGRDPVRAETHDSSGTNNANFSTRGDGSSGRMQMYLWGTSSLLTVLAPDDLAGNRRTGSAEFGARVGEEPLTAQLAIGRDSTQSPKLGCSTLINPEEVRGKIALIDRGDCTFQQKAFNAEQAGAVGVIICNPANDLLTMAAVNDRDDIPVTIPAVLLRERDCTPLKQVITAGETVEVAFQDNNLTPTDGSFDNGVVAHEYAHGLSIRLVGGPSEYTCLQNDEQMGEGWSDFFLLASTPQSATPTPNGTEERGIGVYSTSGESGARGFRSQFYSTDFAINSHTYDDVITDAIPHGVGETWAAALWDLYWRMVETYGFDEDLITGTGGNNAAVRLVVEGMKYTPCSPGLVDGRDALLVADQVLNGGANACMIWEVFTRRGLGVSAKQGSADLRSDNREAFDLLPDCIPTVKLLKQADTTFISPGDEITHTLIVRNDKPTAVTSLTVTDVLPAGVQLVAGSIHKGGAEVSPSTSALTITLGQLGAGARDTVSYTVITPPDATSSRLLYSNADTTDEALWDVVSGTGTATWVRSDSTPFAGRHAWFVPNTASAQDQILQLRDPLTIGGPRPALRFFTKYRTEAAFDAGVVEVSTNGTDWENVDGKFLRYGYRGLINSRAAGTLRGTPTFWGNSEGYREAIVDLTAYRGQAIYLRYRFVTDGSFGAGGWWVDEIEVLSDLLTYNGLATLTTAEGDTSTARVPEHGVVVNVSEIISDIATRSLPTNRSVRMYPNPATDRVQLWLQAAGSGELLLELFSVDGRRLLRQTTRVEQGSGALDFSVAGLPNGQYTVRLTEATALTTAKLTVAR